MANGVDDEVTQEEAPLTPVNQFQVDAFDILNNATDYQSAINSLVDYYKNNKFDSPDTAKEVLSDYSNDLRYKFKEGLDLSSTVDMAPIKMSSIAGEDPVERINSWEKQNLDYLGSTDDADYIAGKHQLSDSIKSLASEARRDELSGEDGLIQWGKDKFFRFAEGAVSPFAKLAGSPEIAAPLRERTSRSQDNSIAGAIASTLGFLAPAVAVGAATGGVGVTPLIAAQSAGEVVGAYDASIKATGDSTRAMESALLTGAAQTITFFPLGRAVEAGIGRLGIKAGEEIAGKTLDDALISALNTQKDTFGNVARATLEAGTLGSAGQVIGNLAANVGLDENGDITHGAADAFLTNAIVAGGIHGATSLYKNAAINQLQNTIKEAKDFHLKMKTPEQQKEIQEADKTSNPQFMVNPDGNLEVIPPKPRTVEQRQVDAEFYNKAVDDYIHEPPKEEVIANEAGEEQPMASSPDIELPNIPDGVVFTDTQLEHSPSVASTWFAGKVLGAQFELRKNILNGALGSFTPKNNKVKILRSLGANPEALKATIAHELTHFLDKILNNGFESKGLKTVAEKLSGIAGIAKESTIAGQLAGRAAYLSGRWRKGWDGLPGDPRSTDPVQRYNAYRNRPEEIYADVGSAILANPDFVRKEFPDIFSVFESSLARNKDLNGFWTQWQKLAADPKELSRFNMGIRLESRQKSAQILAAERLNKVKNNAIGAKLQRHLDQAFEFVFNKHHAASEIASKQSGEEREVAFTSLLNIKRKDYLYHVLDREINAPIKQQLLKIQEAGIPINTWAHYEWGNHLINDSTVAMGKVENDFPTYQEAARVLQKTLKEIPGVKKGLVDEVFTPEAFTSPEKLNDAFAQLGIIGDTADVLHIDDFKYRYDPADPKRDQKAMRDYNLAVSRLNKRKESIPIEKLRQAITKLPNSEVKDALVDVTKDGAFNARKYLVNADGATVYDARRDLATIEADLTPEQFSTLREASENFHKALGKIIPTVKESGIFSPEVLERISRNKSSYVTTNVLKYFEGADSIDSSIKKAIGSLSETGDELSATFLKNAAIFERAKFQIAQNSAVDLARMGHQLLEEIPQTYGKNIFDEKRKLSAQDRDNSYIISYKEGVPTLNKLATKSWENMFKNVKDLPGLNWLLDLTDQLNRGFLVKSFKTVLSPAFYLGQKYLDRKLEAIMANSFEFQFGLPIHTSKKLRVPDNAHKEEIRQFKKTGELTGDLKKVIDLDGAILDIHTLSADGEPTALSFADAIVESYGVKLPNEETTLERLGSFTQKQLDKVGAKKLREATEFDELRTKVNGFKIGKMRGMGDAEAAVFAQERFGVPDPLGGGVAAPLINRFFLFGRAHLNGLRTLGSLVKDTPKTALTQTLYRAVLPKLLMAGAVVGPAIRAAMGDETADVYLEGIRRIPKYDKIATNPILLGFQDGQGNYHNLYETKLSQVQADWKAWYTREPQARELTSIAKVFWPFIENLGTGDITGAIAGAASGAGSQLMGNVQPSLQYFYNMLEMVKGENPTDFYRMKGILNKDVALGGSPLDKAEGYGQYLLASNYPSIAPYNPFSTAESKGPLETTIRKAPLVGPLVRKLVGVSNYGLIEESKEGEIARERLDAQIILSAGDNTREVISEYRTANGRISSLGKGWQEKVGPNVAQQSRLLTSWHSRIWTPYKNELRAAHEAGDSERYSSLVKDLESSASDLVSALKQYDEKEK